MYDSNQLFTINDLHSLEPVFLDAGLIFYFTFYLLGGVRTRPTHPLPTSLGRVTTCTTDSSGIGARRRLGHDATNTTQQGRHAAAMRSVANLLWALVIYHAASLC